MKLSAILFSALLSLFLSVRLEAQYIEVWSDEFDYEGLPDPGKWSYDVGGHGFGNEELQYYTNSRSENARVENGKLIIEARKEPYNGSEYTSAKLISRGKGDWKYGRFEIRAKLPTGRGIWPAIWMLPTHSVYGNWPASGEIDIMELVGYEPEKVHFTIHTEAYNHKIGTQVGTGTTLAAPYNNFYTYALEWTEDSLKFFVDDNLYFSVKREDNDYAKWPFDQPFYLLLNVAVGGTWGGSNGIDDAIFPQTMEVDYVRVYKMAEEGNNFSLNTYASNGTVQINPEKQNYTRGENVAITAIPDEGYEFIAWSGSFSGTAEQVALPMYFNYDIKAEFARKGEILTNASFFNSTLAWSYYGASMNAENDTLVASIPTSTTNPWDIQISQNGLYLENGATYTLRFKVSSETSRNVNASVGISQEPWTTFISKTVSIGTVEKEFVYEFTMNTDEENARVSFDLGKEAGDVYISEVSLVKNDEITGLFNNQLSTNSLKVYPHPNDGVFSISGTNEDYIIRNNLGVIVFKGRGNGLVDLQSLPSGIYLIESKDHQRFRLIIQ